MVSAEQEQFIMECLFTFGGNMERAATFQGVTKRELFEWHRDAEFRQAFEQAQATYLHLLGLSPLNMAQKLMMLINADLSDVAQVGSLEELAGSDASTTYPVQSIKRFYDDEGRVSSIEVKHFDKVKPLLAMLDKIIPKIEEYVTRLGGGEEDPRLAGVSIELPLEVLREYNMLPPPLPTPTRTEKPDIEDEVDVWLHS